MPTKLQVITDALTLIGVVAPGETVAASDLDVAGRNFDGYIDRLNSQKLSIFSEQVLEFTMAAGQQTRTLGTGGNFNTVRPMEILWANMIFAPGTPQEVRRPLNQYDYQQWANYRFLAASGPPDGFWNDNNWPRATLHFYPIPDQAYGLELFVRRRLEVAAPMNTDINFPPGYADLLLYNLAERFCGLFNLPIPPLVAREAQRTNIEVLGQNAFTPDRILDPELRNKRQGGLYNWLTGQFQ